MRPQDPVPEWTTHLALIRKDGTVHTGRKQDVLDAAAETLHRGWDAPSIQTKETVNTGEAIIDLAGVNVAYGNRKVGSRS